jgi:ATP-dependent RNA helicase DDX54/DBP10
VRDTDAPYLIDLQLFLGKKLIVGRDAGSCNYVEDVTVGAPMRSKVEANVEWLNKLLLEDEDVNALRRVSEKAEKLYLRTRNSASSQSARRAREIVSSKGWMQLHPVFGGELGDAEDTRAEMLARISGYRPKENIFESKMANGKVTNSSAAEVMRSLREKITPRNQVKKQNHPEDSDDAAALENTEADGFSDEEEVVVEEGDIDMDSDSDLEVTVSNNTKMADKTPSSWQDSEIFMTYTPRTTNVAEEKGSGVHSGGNFVESARNATVSLVLFQRHTLL